MDNDAIAERERKPHSRGTRLFCFIKGWIEMCKKKERDVGARYLEVLVEKDEKWKMGLEFERENVSYKNLISFFTSRVNHKTCLDISILPHHLKSF